MRTRIALLPLYSLLLCAVLALVAPVPVAATAPASASLKGVPATGQIWSLSCEYAAVSAATAYYGKKVTQQTFHSAIGNHLNPHKGFRGDIAGGPWGGITNYGVYAEPIVPVLKRWGFGKSYAFYSGAETLKTEVAAGRPVVVWLVGTYSPQGRTVRTDTDGERFSLIPYEHAVVVTAYDAGGVTVMDPGPASTYKLSWAKFDAAWAQLDRMSLVVAR